MPALRGGKPGHWRNCEDTCNALLFDVPTPKKSYYYATSLRSYTPIIPHQEPICNSQDPKVTPRSHARHGHMHPTLIKRLTATSAPEPKHQTTTNADTIMHWLKITRFGIIWVCLGCSVGRMRHGMDDARTTGPYWDPAGNAPFREFVREVHAWLNATSGTMTAPQQAAALQRGLGGLARTIAMRVPSAVVDFGVSMQGQRTDAVTHNTLFLSTKFEKNKYE